MSRWKLGSKVRISGLYPQLYHLTYLAQHRTIDIFKCGVWYLAILLPQYTSNITFHLLQYSLTIDPRPFFRHIPKGRCPSLSGPTTSTLDSRLDTDRCLDSHGPMDQGLRSGRMDLLVGFYKILHQAKGRIDTLAKFNIDPEKLPS